jgi:MYXO-CTERM domain-containing protein
MGVRALTVEAKEALMPATRLAIGCLLEALLLSSAPCWLGCAGPVGGTDPMGEAPPGAVRGEVQSYVATLDDGTTDEYYTLRRGDTERRLQFDGDPGLAAGSIVDVWGTPMGERLLVTRYQVADVPRPIEQALKAPTPYQARSIVMAVVRIGAPPAMPLNQDVARTKLFGTTPSTQPSVRQYYVEASYGRQDIAGEVLGPFEFPMATGCMTSQLASAIRPMIPGTFSHYLWYMEPRNAACGFSGLASSGTPTRPARDTWYNASSGCVVLMQEPGHNFGMQHSSFMKCPGAAFADEPNGTCTHNEYGDRYDPMGSGCRHMNAYQKTYQGWLDKCNMVDIGSSGTFTLLPLELPCDGVQALSIKMPKVRPFLRSGGGGQPSTDMLNRYYVELRTPVGIDKGLQPSVQIRVGGDISERNRRGLHTWFLDMDPSTTNQDGLAVGATFADPSGSPKITLVSMDATKATVKVEFEGGGTDAPTCIDGTAFEGSGPGPESCAAAPAAPSGAPPLIPDGGVMNPPVVRDGGGSRPDGSAPRADATPLMADAGAPDRMLAADLPPLQAPPPKDAAPSAPTSVDAGETPEETKVSASGCHCDVGGGGRPGPLVLLGLGLLLARRRRKPDR